MRGIQAPRQDCRRARLSGATLSAGGKPPHDFIVQYQRTTRLTRKAISARAAFSSASLMLSRCARIYSGATTGRMNSRRYR